MKVSEMREQGHPSDHITVSARIQLRGLKFADKEQGAEGQSGAMLHETTRALAAPATLLFWYSARTEGLLVSMFFSSLYFFSCHYGEKRSDG